MFVRTGIWLIAPEHDVVAGLIMTPPDLPPKCCSYSMSSSSELQRMASYGTTPGPPEAKTPESPLNLQTNDETPVPLQDHTIRKEKERSQRDASALLQTTSAPAAVLQPAPLATNALPRPIPTPSTTAFTATASPVAATTGSTRPGSGSRAGGSFADPTEYLKSAKASAKSSPHAEARDDDRSSDPHAGAATKGQERERSRLHVSSVPVGGGDAESPRKGGGSADGKSSGTGVRGKRGREEGEERRDSRDDSRDPSTGGEGREEGHKEERDRYRKSRAVASGPERDRESEREKSARRGGAEAEGGTNAAGHAECDTK